MKLPETRSAGVCLHLTALAGPYGIGELGAFAFIDQMKAMGLTIWQFLPLGPTAYGDSPYQSLSTFAGNEMLIDIGQLINIGLLKDDEVMALTSLPTDRVDYGQLIPIKRVLLAKAAGRFATDADTTLKTAYEDFLRQHQQNWLQDYALFRVLKDQHDQRSWTEWEPRYKFREPDALAQIRRDKAQELEAIQVMQFLFDYQCRALKTYAAENGVLLLGDVPIYIALDSADAWAHTEIVALDEKAEPQQVAGVPPDYYSADGQLWGNPIYDWDYHKRTGYRWWIDRIAHTMSLMDIVRIDHFRGFEAYWSVPYGATTARNGSWEPGPGQAIFAALHAAFGELPIVAENLGVITPEVEALREKYRMPGMVILQFDASKPDFNIDSVADDCVCYTGTHDNDTTVGWFNGGPGDIRSRAEVEQEQRVVLEKTKGSPESIHLDLIRLAYTSRARIAMIPMQDYLGLGSEARFNIPGTQANNWRWRLTSEQITPALCESIAEMVRHSGRHSDPHSDRHP